MSTPEDPGARPLDLTALKALSHPLRVAIIAALAGYGPATASALAERLGESSGATSYHLRQLEKHGFVREDAARGSGRERWWERVPRMIQLDTTGFDPDGAERAASDLVSAEFERTRHARLQAFLARGRDVLDPAWLAASELSTVNLQLTREQSAELVAELTAVRDAYRARYRDQRVPGARPIEVHVDVFPLIDGVEQAGDVGGTGKTETR